ncbi:uncharacterized protein K460DRAFT_395843 [Cucurbitaria berberidis CBS 394.84]|uniref:Uncharacterized protein n=1 Tax=Cucurbitaria berberidis CBS 394.84 TaxID=1168544 RepID=A0A9P4GJA6_9PLEO|nr:uncharacterized protein K460DRAFT_395843 [Cucurbitaria berberidis CBS 394.84]KAF1846436.1 hypothetical protein K460DRAFT_395843 [Cucurbitaria berberidis CBS 394.84]
MSSLVQAAGIASTLRVRDEKRSVLSGDPKYCELPQPPVGLGGSSRNLELACKTVDKLQWASTISWQGQAAFVAQPQRMWSNGGEEVGWYKEVRMESASGRETTIAFATVDCWTYGTFDKLKEALALALVDRWLNGYALCHQLEEAERDAYP